MSVLILPNYLDTAQLLSVTRIEEELNCVIDGSYFDVPRVEFTAYEKHLEREGVDTCGKRPRLRSGHWAGMLCVPESTPFNALIRVIFYEATPSLVLIKTGNPDDFE